MISKHGKAVLGRFNDPAPCWPRAEWEAFKAGMTLIRQWSEREREALRSSFPTIHPKRAKFRSSKP